MHYLCFLCGAELDGAALLDGAPTLSICPECCIEHERDREGVCAWCFDPAPYDWWEDDDPNPYCFPYDEDLDG